MARQVIKQKGVLRESSQSNPDDFKARLIKMIPGEVVAVYLACNTAIYQLAPTNITAYWFVFGIIMVLMVFYLRRTMKVTDLAQIIIMMIAFLLWCLTIDKPFDTIFSDAKEQKLVSTLALTIFTFGVPIFYKGN